ncbi:MAG: 50S ribosomal protein L6 [Patescibacteria group bacterium UBA2103]
MSRLGKKPVAIPSGTDVKVESGVLTVKGPKGELVKPVHSLVEVSVADSEVTVAPKNNSRLARALWGTFASHVRNMITGVNDEYKKVLILEGVGYRVELAGRTLKLMVGYSHPVEMELPEGVNAEVVKNTITISGADKEKVGQFAAEVRAKKKPEPYKGKGLRYDDEVIRRKQGKKAV